MPPLLVLLCAAIGSGPALAADLLPRAPLESPPITLPPLPNASPVAAWQLQFKLRDDLRARADGRGGVHARAPLPGLTRVIQADNLTISPLIRISEQRVADLVARAEARTGRAQPDLMAMMSAEVPRGDPDALVDAAYALDALDEVEWVQIVVIGVPPPGDISPTTPDYTASQTWLGPDPGLDLEGGWDLGTTGWNLRVADAEYGWEDTHEDFVDRDLNLEAGHTVPSWVASYGWDSHGTAAYGEIMAIENGYGCTGGAHDAETGTYPEYSNEGGSRRADAIASALADSETGDIVMLEMQNGSYAPAEADASVWSVVSVGTAAGVVVVGAAGNGTQNLDASGYTTYMGWGDSGAVLVGAGSPDTNHDALYFSSYGTRVDVQGWGSSVFTLGYGDYARLGSDPDQEYTSAFSGTSSATPMVTAAAALVQDYVLGSGADPLSPESLRALLTDTGVPQGTGGHIGPLPDVTAAIAALDGDGDGWPNADYGGTDCEDDDPDAYPGAADVWYDGVDGDCDGADDYDADADGYASAAYDGDDCDDDDPDVSPAAEDTWYDGVDTDCDGADDYDADADGYASAAYDGDDCDDDDPDVSPGAPEARGDGVDNDCDGHDEDYDGDGDGRIDLDEVEVHGTDPTSMDTDGDGLDDAEELALGTDPTSDDTDGDGESDGDEVAAGHDPLVADDVDGKTDRRTCASSPAAPSGVLALAALAALSARRRRQSATS